MTEEATIDVKEAARLLKTTTINVRYWAREGKLPGIKIGRTWWFTESAIAAFRRGGQEEK